MALIKQRFGIDAVTTDGRTGQFDILADGKLIAGRGGNWFTRSLGAGYPDFESVVEQLAEHRG